MACNHTTWLNLAAGPQNKHTFIFSHRLSTLIDTGELPDPSAQTPSMVTFIGGASKNRILRGLISQRSLQAAISAAALCSLHVATSTAKSQNPLLIADCLAPNALRLSHRRMGPKDEESCHRNTRKLLSSQDSRIVSTSMFSRLLGPFSDTVCLFSADLGGLEGVARFVQDWMSPGEISTHPEVCRPNLLIVEERAVLRAEWDAPASQTFLEMVSPQLYSFFLSVNVLSIPTGYQSLMQYLKPLLELTRKIRKVGRCIFTLAHFNAFITAACHHWAQHPTSTFDFVQTTRSINPVPPKLPEHLSRFFSLLEPEHGIELAASSLVLDSSPSGMHCFEPLVVFDRLYREILKPITTSSFLEWLSYRFANMTLSMEAQGLDAIELHRITLKQYYGKLSTIYSRLTCLCCLCRSPERGLPCGHTLCEPCIQAFGQRIDPELHIYSMPGCPLCGKATPDFRAYIKPPTAGVRILSIDGGGVRGVLPLRALENLETAFSSLTGISGPIQEHFDLALGTSSGGLIVLGLFLNGWSVADCSKQFVRLAEKAFGKPRRLLMSLLSDSRYGASDMEEALQDAFGTNRALLDWSNVGPLTTKVAVTATTTDTSSPCVFANYTGERDRPSNCGYKLISLPNDQKIPIWEAARCTSAAPSYLPPHILRNTNLGSFEDGGLTHNNPVNLARWESRIVWPQTTPTDIVLSMGTGTSPPKPSNTRGWRGCSFARLYRIFMTSLDGQKAWEELQNHIPEEQKAGYFRLNAALDGGEPALDDLTEMHRLKDLHMQTPQELNIAESLVAKQFYFEFIQTPRYIQGRYECSGYLRCRFGQAQQTKLVQYLAKKSARFAISGLDIAILDGPPLMLNGVFRQRVDFSVNSLSDEFSIWLVVDTKSKTISGFPTSAAALIRNQGLDNPFGSVHGWGHGLGEPLLVKRRKK